MSNNNRNRGGEGGRGRGGGFDRGGRGSSQQSSNTNRPGTCTGLESLPCVGANLPHEIIFMNDESLTILNQALFAWVNLTLNHLYIALNQVHRV